MYFREKFHQKGESFTFHWRNKKGKISVHRIE